MDINVLIALLDANHQFHEAAKTWLTGHIRYGWASCPLTQNGVVRILSQPRYPNALSPNEAIRALRSATSHRAHEFWADDVSLLDTAAIHGDHLHGARQITDAYLLALAIRHGGRLVTFDDRMTLSAVVGADTKHLIVL